MLSDPDDVESQLLALAEADRQLGDRIDTLSDITESLTETVAIVAPPAGAAMAGLWWADLDDETRRQTWSEFVEWLATVLLTHRSDVAGALAPCWHRHPAVVDDLTMLWATWRAAYRSPRPAPTAVPEWLDRWLPNARRRIEAETKECRRRDHIEAKAPRDDLITDDTHAWVGGAAPAQTPTG